MARRPAVSLVNLPLTVALLVAVPASPSRSLRARFEADLVFVTMRTHSGAELSLFTDTGGGMLLTAAAAARAGITVTPVTDATTVAQLGPGAGIADPPALAAEEPAPAYPRGQKIVVTPRDLVPMPGYPALGDGMLGQAWFGGHVWTWDYPGHRLVLRPEGWHPAYTGHELSVGFRHEVGSPALWFPRIVVMVDGDSISLLLDTGASTLLTPIGLAAIHDGGPAYRATSMIAHAVFEGWQNAHPDWPVVDSAQVGTNSRMIRVPSVSIAGIVTGPVWFTERPDAAFRQYMSSMTDADVDGALGGNAFHALEMTVDYPGGRAWFVCRTMCRAAP